MIWSASVLSALSSDTEPTIVINFGSGKYIFNGGENVGRSWLQSRNRWRGARGLFLTSIGTQRGSGVPGLMMFFADASIQRLEVLGPQGLLHYIASMRSYLWRDTMCVKPTEVDCRALISEDQPSTVYKDENIELYAIPLHSESIQASEQLEDGSSKRKRSPSPESASKRTQFEARNKSDSRSVLDLARNFNFYPSSLRAAEAQEWRRLTAENMFPGLPGSSTQPDTMEGQSVSKGKKKGKKNANEIQPAEAGTQSLVANSAPAAPRRPEDVRHLPMKPHRYKRLPKFAPLNSEFSNDPNLKEVLCYVVVGPRVRGRFDLERAKSLGLMPGPNYSKLIKGQSVTIMVDDENGGKIERTIMPEDCVGPSEAPKVVMVLDVPSQAYIPSLITAFDGSPFYSRLRSNKEEDKKEFTVHAVFHICGDGVLEDARYKTFMNGFSDTTHHLVSSPEHAPDPITFTSAAFNQLRLNQLDSDMFPVPYFRWDAKKDLSSVSGLPANTTLMRSHTTVDVRPPRAPAIDKEAEEYDKFHPAVTSAVPLVLPTPVQDAFATAKAALDSEERIPQPGDDVVILPLGTSSATPSKYRNVSSTLIQIPGHGNILLDTGEGTWSQLVRFFGDGPDHSTGVWQVLRDLKCIFLSHVHGDHHIGLAKILAMRRRLNPPPAEPLYVVGLRPILLYLREWSELEDLGLDSPDGNGVITILSDALNWRESRIYGRPNREDQSWMDANESKASAKDMCRALGLREFITVDVDHRTRCYGVSIVHDDGWSIVFSADTMPTENLVKVGQNATLLIHEATMGDDQQELAQQKAHSTFGQAVDIGKRMNAKNILLTHFSARYPKMPPSETVPAPSSEGPTTPILALAFDHARIRIGDMHKLRSYLPAIEQSFADIVEEDEEDPDPARAAW